jgi:hypothetical protein
MEDIIHINDELSYSKIENCYVIHNLTEKQSEDLLNNLEIGSWILRSDNQYGLNINAITIKISDGYVHHKDFYFSLYNNCKIYILSRKKYLFLDETNKEQIIWYKKTYDTMKEYLLYLSKIYGLNIDKQIIYEND